MKITICGCGNASQLMTALIAQARKHQVFVYAPFQDEAARFRRAIDTAPNKAIDLVGPEPGSHTLVSVDSSNITEDPRVAICDADLIFLPLPAFAVGPTLKQIFPFVKHGAYVGVLPGQGGCQWAAAKALGKFTDRGIVLFATEKLPYNVRIEQFGRSIRVFSYKRVGIGAVPAGKSTDAANLMNRCVPFTDAVPLNSILVTTLATGNQCIHPVRVRSLHRTQPFTHNPLFYEEMDDTAVQDMQAVSDEIMAIAKAIEKRSSAKLEQVLDVHTALTQAYGSEIADASTLKTTLRTAAGFKGITSPLKQVDGEWVVDFQSRYVQDDVPYGLCVLRGIAELVDVNTPTIDSLITWAEENMKKRYLVDGRLAGADAMKTGAPQAYGFTALKDLPDFD